MAEIFYVDMNITGDTRKRALLLHCSGADVQDIFETLPDKGTTYDQAKAVLNTNFISHSNECYEQWLFQKHPSER